MEVDGNLHGLDCSSEGTWQDGEDRSMGKDFSHKTQKKLTYTSISRENRARNLVVVVKHAMEYIFLESLD